MSNTTSDSPRDAHADEDADAGASRASVVTSAPLILCVDSASDARSVAVARGAELICIVREATERGSSSVLLSEIDDALAQARVALAEIDLYAVTTGPGSFTGLRAGLATIKAFAAVRRRPVAAVPTLAAVALSAGESARTVAMIPAGRGEVFAQAFRVDTDARVEALDAPTHVAPAAHVARMIERGGAVLWVGGGAHAHAALIREMAERARIKFVEQAEDDAQDSNEPKDGSSDLHEGESHDAEPRASIWMLARAAKNYAAQIARLGLIRSLIDETVRAEELRAEYVRLSDAELNERCRR